MIMNPYLQKTLSILGIKRKKPKTKIGKIVRRGEHILTVSLLLYLGVHFYPQPLFGHQLDHDGITLYSTEPIPVDKGEELLSQIRAEISVSEIHDSKKKFKIFICNSKALYTFLGPLSRDGFGFIYLNIIIAHADLETNMAKAYRAKHNTRSFTSVATHEICHKMIRDKFGFLSGHTKPKWLQEGYCEYIAKESTFPENLGYEMIAKGKADKSNSFKYFEYRKMVEFYLDKKGYTIEQLFSSPPSESDARNQMRNWLSNQNPPS